MTRSRRTAPAAALSPDTLRRAPHLGPLDLATHALHLAAMTRYAELPALIGEPHPGRPEPPEVVVARRLLRQMARLDEAIERYRRTLAPLLTPPAPQSDDDADF